MFVTKMNLVLNFLKPHSELIFLDQIIVVTVLNRLQNDRCFSASPMFIIYHTEFLLSTLIDYRQAENVVSKFLLSCLGFIERQLLEIEGFFGGDNM